MLVSALTIVHLDSEVIVDLCKYLPDKSLDAALVAHMVANEKVAVLFTAIYAYCVLVVGCFAANVRIANEKLTVMLSASVAYSLLVIGSLAAEVVLANDTDRYLKAYAAVLGINIKVIGYACLKLKDQGCVLRAAE